jgi:molybdopterin converting factor small subunit
MAIKIKGYLTFKHTIGDQVLNLDENKKLTLNELLIKFSSGEKLGDVTCPAEPNLLGSRVIVLVNGLHLSQLPDRLDTILKDKDEIAIFPPMAGG